MIRSEIEELCTIFSEKFIKPNVAKWDKNNAFTDDIYMNLSHYGLFGMTIPSEFGGSGMNYLEYTTALTQISMVCGSLGLSLAAHNSLSSQHILLFGNDNQKQKYLPILASENLGAWALTEAESGSDSGALQCTAVKDGDNWVINGSKMFITHGASAKVCVLLARTGSINEKHNISAFIVESGTKGFTAGPPLNKMGMKASETTPIYFDNCIVSNKNLLGNEGDGFKQAMKILEGGRLSIAALSLGIAKGAYKAALEYSKQRKQFGRQIASFQTIAFSLADMEIKIQAAALMLRHACELKIQDSEITKESAMAKLYASEIAVEVSGQAVQIMGGYGYITDYMVEKHYRDAKLCTIGEGTSEIQRLIISRSILA